MTKACEIVTTAGDRGPRRVPPTAVATRCASRNSRPPFSRDDARLVRRIGPRRHGDAEYFQRTCAGRPELKARAERQRDACAWHQPRNLSASTKRTPHSAATSQHIPNLVNGLVLDGF